MNRDDERKREQKRFEENNRKKDDCFEANSQKASRQNCKNN
jgi:hypothetical protein